jgi:hypothetical protein
MKRDMDLLRAFLLRVEEVPYKFGGIGAPVEVPGYSSEEVYYHALLAQDEKLIEAKFSRNGLAFVVVRLTYQGHEFLDLARDDTRWNKAKEKVKSTTGTLAVETLKTALSFLAQAALKNALAQ